VKRSGWLTFASIVLVVAGIMRVFDAIWAFRYKGTVVDGLHQALFGSSLTTYGWIWLIVGVILILSGAFIMTSRGIEGAIGRWVGVVAAAIAAITAITWLPYYPIWALVYTGLALAVIYALTAHFDEPAAHSQRERVS
jgi:hypothetical protein